MLATDVLKSEHHSIGRMLALAQRAGNRLDIGQDVPPQLLQNATAFFVNYADGCHSGKEDAGFLPALAHAGMLKTFCPITLITTEHQQARQLSRTLADIADRFLQGDRKIRRTLVLAVRSYVNLVQPHIVRENSIVFPMADAMLPATEHDRLLGDFDVIETTLLGERRRQHFEAMLDEMEALVAAWPSPLAAPSAHLSPTFFSSVRAY